MALCAGPKALSFDVDRFLDAADLDEVMKLLQHPR